MDDKRPVEESGYEKPDVVSEEVFETLALTCSKVDAQCLQPEGTPSVQS
jgi:hypothetical protein